MLKNLSSIRHFQLSKSFLVHSTTRNAPYFLPHFDRPKIRSVFSNAPRLDLALQNRFRIQNYPPEKKKQNTCFEMPLLLQIFGIALIYLLMIVSKKNPHEIQFLLILLSRLANQTANATILKNFN